MNICSGRSRISCRGGGGGGGRQFPKRSDYFMLTKHVFDVKRTRE